MSQTSLNKGTNQLQADEKLMTLSRSAIIHLDSDYRILAASSTIQLLTGYEAEDLLGKSYLDLLVQAYQEAFHVIMQKDEIAHLDYPLSQKNGEWLWLRHSSQASSEGDKLEYHCVLQDVSHYKQARDEVERERNLLRSIIENHPDAIHVKDDEGKYIFSNAAHSRLMGKARSVDVIGRTGKELLDPSIAERFAAEDKAVLQGKQIEQEVKYQPVEGLEKILFASKLPLRDAKGKIIGIIGVARDISEQKASQEQLRVSEARNRALLNALPDMMFVARSDGTISEFHSNANWESLGFDASVLDKKIQELGLPKSFLEDWLNYCNLALESPEIQSFEFSPSSQNGSNEYYEARMLALNEEEVLTLIRDISALKRIQDELSQHIDDLTVVRQVNVELAANLNFNYVVQLALDAALRLSNAQSGYLVMVESLGALTCLSFVGEYNFKELNHTLEEKKGIIPRIIRSLEPELILDVEQDKDYYPLLENTKAMMVIPLISNERLVGVLVLEARRAERFSHERFQFLQLITGRIAAFLDNANLYRQTQDQLKELKQLYEEVRHLEQLKTDMIRVASHDLKNPLAGVMGFVEMLKMDMEDRLNDKDREYFGKIETAARKMQTITSSILSLERIQELSKRQAREDIDLSEMLRRSIGEQMDGIVRKEQNIERHFPTEAVIVQGDPMQLHEAFFNLLNNAIKYTPQSGNISVYLDIEDNMAKVRIVDTGYGIPEDQQERLFSPFFRAKTTETRFIEGTGLGLHLVKNIIERHDGKMFFESVYGEGSNFGFDIPLKGKKPLEDTQPKRINF